MTSSNRSRLRRLAATLALLCVAAMSVAQDAPRTASFSFAEQPADAVFAALSKMYGMPFRAAAPLSEPVSVDSRGQVSLERAVSLLDEALSAQGQSARLEDGIVKISPRSGLLSVEIEVIVLKHSDPEAVAKVVMELFRSRDVLTELADKDPKLLEQLLPQLAAGSRPTESLKVEATPWPPLNAVIVKAPKRVMPMIRRFIESNLDEAEGVVKAEAARRAAEAAKRKAEADRQAAEAKKRREEEERKKKANQPPPPPDKTRTFQPSFVQADYIADYCRRLKNVGLTKLPNNLLMLTTNKYEQFDQVQEVMDMLDVPDSTSLQQYYIPLKHATAKEVRDLLGKLFSYTLQQPVTAAGARKLIRARRTKDLPTGLRGRFTAEGADNAEGEAPNAEQQVDEVTITEEDLPAELAGIDEITIPVGDITIVPDERNNALIIRTLPANIESIRNIIERIDRPTGQVLIEVFIAELTLDNNLELGVDFVNTGVLDGFPIGERYSYTTGQNFDVTGNLTGFTYNLISDNITSFIRALKTTSRLDVVSRPSITTLDNTPAVFEFGSQVPLIQASNVNINGEVISSVVRYERIGTKLEVTPHINEAGFVTLKIEQTIDDVSDEKFTISEQLEPQLLIRRFAKTNVRVFDGQTVFLGGFIDDKIDDAESMVPLLGDIPWLGNLFKSSKKVRSKTELLIFITPRIVSTPEELTAQSDRVRQRSQHLRDGGRVPLELRNQTPPSDHNVSATQAEASEPSLQQEAATDETDSGRAVEDAQGDASEATTEQAADNETPDE